ncbi:ghkl domain protein [Lasius niger]|uniref:Ghkl domain protein n=1 Tax=Lasius niger TaxID=67767 RepID=A0A0J7NVP2_LASNI|nr:ghkl domain protein [Lasius niger]
MRNIATINRRRKIETENRRAKRGTVFRGVKIARSWEVFAWGRKGGVIGSTTRTSVAFELGPPLNMATDGPDD